MRIKSQSFRGVKLTMENSWLIINLSRLRIVETDDETTREIGNKLIADWKKDGTIYFDAYFDANWSNIWTVTVTGNEISPEVLKKKFEKYWEITCNKLAKKAGNGQWVKKGALSGNSVIKVKSCHT